MTLGGQSCSSIKLGEYVLNFGPSLPVFSVYIEPTNDGAQNYHWYQNNRI